jgi:hypothetical protein
VNGEVLTTPPDDCTVWPIDKATRDAREKSCELKLPSRVLLRPGRRIAGVRPPSQSADRVRCFAGDKLPPSQYGRWFVAREDVLQVART